MTIEYDSSLLRTVHLVPLTAFGEDGRIDVSVQSNHVTRMYAAGMRVFLPAAGTSEFQSLSADEVVELVRITRENSAPDAQIFAPVGLQVGHAIDVGRRSLEAGATGIMFMPFVHPYMSDAGARDYYLEVMDAVPSPTLIYRKGPIPTDQLLLELADDPRVVGVKYAVNQMHEFRTTVLADGGRIEWLCGSAERFAPFYMLVGSGGYTTGAGNLTPCVTLAMHAALSAGEYQEALELQSVLLPIEDYRARSGDSFNVSMLKYAMSLVGSDFGPPRAPGRQLSVDERLEIDALMAPILEIESSMRAELVDVGLTDS
jgi:4-hydroxy-tetrahydrodipicolinate synthase